MPAFLPMRCGRKPKLTIEQAEIIRSMFLCRHVPQSKIARRFGISVPLVSGIIMGHKWNPTGGAPRPRRHNEKLTEDQVREIRKLRAEGISKPEIAKIFGITPSNVKQVVRRTSWAHVI